MTCFHEYHYCLLSCKPSVISAEQHCHVLISFWKSLNNGITAWMLWALCSSYCKGRGKLFDPASIPSAKYNCMCNYLKMIVFIGLEWTYPQREQPVLCHHAFTVAQGQRVKPTHVLLLRLPPAEESQRHDLFSFVTVSWRFIFWCNASQI